jgi:sugar phosphate isomerase/epimerase
MSETTMHRTSAVVALASFCDGRLLGGRLGLDVPRDMWPTAPELKRLEACGYGWIQMHAPPIEQLADRVSVLRHADCLRAVLGPTSLRVVLHAPDGLCLGREPDDRAFAGLLELAIACAAEAVVYHGACHPVAVGVEADRVEDRLLAEERALRRFADRAEDAGVVIAVENLAPAYPGPPLLCHAPLLVRDLVRRIGSPAVGLAFDLGHAHVTGQLAGDALLDLLVCASDEIVLFHVHDNLGVRHGPGTPPGILPLALDLHMPPGRGSLPWRAVAPLLSAHAAPLVLEVVPGQRPDPQRLATVSAELLARG